MAKKKSQVIRLVSQAGTGYFYTMRRTIKANMEKCAAAARTRAKCRLSTLARAPLRRLLRIKFDPRVNARVLFKEEKIKKKA